MRLLVFPFTVLLVTVAGGCAPAVVDIRDRLMASARAHDNRFPDGSCAQLTHFAYLGKVHTNKGQLIYVCDVHAVLTGMLSPRGISHIAFFDSNYRFLGAELGARYPAYPQWCEGSRVYLLGASDYGIDPDNGKPPWNVIDLADGFEQRRHVQIPAYGSYLPRSGATLELLINSDEAKKEEWRHQGRAE